MAYLRNLQSDEKLYLLTHHTFGRHSEALDTCIRSPEISRIHAAIEWSGEHWQIRDLGRNGTWLDQHKLAAAENCTLKLQQTINFANHPQNNWYVENLDAPCNLLLGKNSDSATQALSSYHLLPNSEKPLAALSFSNIRGEWLLEMLSPTFNSSEESEVVIIASHGFIELNHYQWQLFLNTEQTQTLAQINQQARAEDCKFHFEVSLDEEHTQLTICNQSEKISLGERSHHYLLLHLARLKAEHAKQGLHSKSQGWINNELLAKELGIDVSHINILIFRARKQIYHAFPDTLGLTDLLQRRRGAVRFNCPQAQISKGLHTETLSA